MDRSDVPLARSAMAGIAAYLLGYVVTYLWQVNTVRESLSGLNALLQLIGAERIPAWTGVGWLFYGSHFVPLRVPALGGGTAVRSIVGGDGATALLFLVPPLALLAAGAVAARWAGADTPERGMAAGAALVVSYLVLAVVGVFVFRYTVGSVTVGVDLLRAVVLAGFVYPVGFGAIGGAVAGTFG